MWRKVNDWYLPRFQVESGGSLRHSGLVAGLDCSRKFISAKVRWSHDRSVFYKPLPIKPEQWVIPLIISPEIITMSSKYGWDVEVECLWIKPFLQSVIDLWFSGVHLTKRLPKIPPCNAVNNKNLLKIFGWCLKRHRKNCKCCPHHSLFKGPYECSNCCFQLSEM